MFKSVIKRYNVTIQYVYNIKVISVILFKGKPKIPTMSKFRNYLKFQAISVKKTKKRKRRVYI